MHYSFQFYYFCNILICYLPRVMLFRHGLYENYALKISSFRAKWKIMCCQSQKSFLQEITFSVRILAYSFQFLLLCVFYYIRERISINMSQKHLLCVYILLQNAYYHSNRGGLLAQYISLNISKIYIKYSVHITPIHYVFMQSLIHKTLHN